MAFRNRQGVERQRRWYEDATGNSDFLKSFRFEVDSQTSLNWYLPEEELDEMREIVDGPEIGARIDDLKRWWQSAAG